MKIVILNEQHTLTPQQVALIGDHELFPVPAAGWDLATQQGRVFDDLAKKVANGLTVVFASPVPATLGLLAAHTAWCKDRGRPYGDVVVLHNDRREKKELPGGKVVFTVATEGWQLVTVA